MKPLLIIFTCVFFATYAPESFAAKKMGTESGGGGGVVWLSPTHPILMDYFTILNSEDEIPKSSEESSGDKAFDKAIEIVAPWKDLPYDVMSLAVWSAFKTISWNFTDLPLTAPPFYFSPHLPPDIKSDVVAYYFFNFEKKKTTVDISRPLWNQMPLNHQAGLLIHEALRHVQIGMGNGYSDETLQRATAIYLLCRPAPRLNYYMQYLLFNSPQLADQIYGAFNTFINQECRGL